MRNMFNNMINFYCCFPSLSLNECCWVNDLIRPCSAINTDFNKKLFLRHEFKKNFLREEHFAGILFKFA